MCQQLEIMLRVYVCLTAVIGRAQIGWGFIEDPGTGNLNPLPLLPSHSLYSSHWWQDADCNQGLERFKNRILPQRKPRLLLCVRCVCVWEKEMDWIFHSYPAPAVINSWRLEDFSFFKASNSISCPSLSLPLHFLSCPTYLHLPSPAVKDPTLTA